MHQDNEQNGYLFYVMLLLITAGFVLSFLPLGV